GTLKISDFGLAKQLGRDSQTQTGTLIGTPEYMAPEQAAGQLQEVDHRSDIYALGVILYELLAGRPPFRGTNSAETYQLVLKRDLVSPGTLVPSLPRDLEPICLKCLMRYHRDRYRTAADLATDLKLFQEGKGIVARPIGPVSRFWRWGRRNPA